MGNRNASAHARGAQAFALEQNFEYDGLVEPGQIFGFARKFLKRLLLILRLQAGNDSLGRDQITKIHSIILPPGSG